MKFLRFHTSTEVGEPQGAVIVKPREGLGLAGLFEMVLKWGTVTTAFLVPLFFLPYTSEFYEFNKQMLLILATTILVVAWFGKMWTQKELRLSRTPLDLPILLLVGAYVVATIFSLNPLVSVLGHFGRFNGGLVSILCYSMLYFVYVNNVRTVEQVKRIAWAMSASGIILAVYGILQYFSVYLLPFDYAKNRFFTPTGSPDVQSYYAMFVLPVMMALLAMTRLTWQRALLLLGVVATFAYIALANLLVALGLAGLAVVVFFYFAREATFVRNRRLFSVVLVVFLALSTLALPFVRNVLPSDFRDVPKEINLDWSSSWSIAATSMSDIKSAVVGTGPDTFLFDFTRFRPVGLNSTPYWNLRFDRASSELLQILATMGIIGLAAFLFLTYRVVKLGLDYMLREKELETHTLSVGFAAGTLALLALGIVFGHFSTVTAFAFWISLALLMRLWAEERQVIVKSTVISVPFGGGEGRSGTRDILPVLTFVPAVVVGLLILFVFGNVFVAEAYFQDSLNAARSNDGKRTYDDQVKAISTDQIGPTGFQVRVDRDIYHSVFSGTNLLLANSLSSQPKPDTNTLQGLVSQAVNEAKSAKDINPYNVNNWEQMATVYRSLVNVVQGSDQFAEQSYAAAIQLDPSNPRLRDSLGTFYSQVKRYDDAINQLGLAEQLKPDLAVAHFDRARALVSRAGVDGTDKSKQRDYMTAAVSEYKATQQLVQKGSADEKQVNQELDSASKQLDALGGPTTTSVTPSPVSPSASPSAVKK